MDLSKRIWMLKTENGEEGPIPEDEFQDRLRRGDIPLFYKIKSNYMDDWKPLLEVVSEDVSFHRESTMPPPPPPKDGN